jgi:hypothetical protein
MALPAAMAYLVRNCGSQQARVSAMGEGHNTVGEGTTRREMGAQWGKGPMDERPRGHVRSPGRWRAPGLGGGVGQRPTGCLSGSSASALGVAALMLEVGGEILRRGLRGHEMSG